MTEQEDDWCIGEEELDTLTSSYTETPEEVAQEYIAAMKYHVDERFLNQDFLSIIYQEVWDYMRDKGVN